MPIIAGDWYKRGNPPILKGEANVETADVAALNITSELLSANALRRSVIIALPALAAGSTAPFTSSFGVWTPSNAVKLVSALLTPLSSWVQTTLQTTPVGTLYNGANAIGTVVIPTTNAPLRGTALSFSAFSNVSVAAGQVLTFGMPTATSAGMTPPAHLLQIDFDSTA